MNKMKKDHKLSCKKKKNRWIFLKLAERVGGSILKCVLFVFKNVWNTTYDIRRCRNGYLKQK